VHARAHRFDQFLHLAALDFRNAERASALAQNGVTYLDDVKFRGIHSFPIRAKVLRELMDFVSVCEDIREERRRKMKFANSKKSAALFFAGMRLVYEAVAAGGPFALGDKCGSSRVGVALLDHF
jgi:hypothetical protein